VTQSFTPDVDDTVFSDLLIGKGLKPLAQHGTAVFGTNGVLTLLGTNGDVIDSAPLSEVKGKRSAITGGQTVSLVLGDRKYNASAKSAGPFGAVKVAKQMIGLIEARRA